MRSLLLLSLLLASVVTHAAFEDWGKPFPAFRVIGNLYGVGTYDLSVFLIATEEGHILINTGLEDSTALIRENVESLGFALEDVKILLSQQAHWDHTAALQEIKERSGAQMWATSRDARVLEDGGFSDPHFGGKETFKPVAVDRILEDGEVIRLGGSALTVHVHPGHTEGSSSYSMVVEEGGRSYNVLIANMGTVNEGKRLAVQPTYPGAAADFAYTYTAQKNMPVDVWVAAHGSQYGLHEKYQPGQAYSPETFVDADGFKAAVASLEARFVQLLAAERITELQDGPRRVVLAGGCFWCVEADLEKLEGVGDVLSGYAGGRTTEPTYENHADHLEVVEAPYDPAQVTYRQIVDYFLRHIDPLDDGGQFCDRGHSYTTAIFYSNPEEKAAAEAAVKAAEAELGRSIVTPVRALDRFWIAEDYHQDYARENPLRYRFYRSRCGRDARVEAVWGDGSG